MIIVAISLIYDCNRYKLLSMINIRIGDHFRTVHKSITALIQHKKFLGEIKTKKEGLCVLAKQNNTHKIM